MLKQFENSLIQHWQQPKPSKIWLKPFSGLFHMASLVRRGWYKCFPSKHLSVPVIVVGNITVGGSGKTPVVIALAHAFADMGFTPGIISRGYKGSLNHQPTLVSAHHSAKEVGDEPLLMHFKTDMPVVIGKDRLLAAKTLLSLRPEVNIIFSDDGLQHYRLPRTKEIAMVDPKSWGNRQLLPQGPLREPLSRLKSVDYILSPDPRIEGYQVTLTQDKATHLKTGEVDDALESFKGRTVHAVAGIANPDRFFKMLKAKGIHVIEHVFEDHHAYSEADFAFDTAYPILITEKDAIKCQNFKQYPIWVVSLDAHISPDFTHQLAEDISHG